MTRTRRSQAALAVLPCLVALALPATAGAQAPGRLNGVVFVGPYCEGPVKCRYFPYRARVRIETFGFKRVVHSSRNDGRFLVSLAPGTYRVTATEPRRSRDGHLAPEPELVTIAPGQLTPVILDFLVYKG